jgi:hypothetical protein
MAGLGEWIYSKANPIPNHPQSEFGSKFQDSGVYRSWQLALKGHPGFKMFLESYILIFKYIIFNQI